MTKKTIITLFSITGILLMIPLFARQFTLEVVWTPMDFIVAGILLLGFGFLIVFAWNKLTKNKYRVYIIAGILLILLLLWAELAVGIFGSPLAGS